MPKDCRVKSRCRTPALHQNNSGKEEAGIQHSGRLSSAALQQFRHSRLHFDVVGRVASDALDTYGNQIGIALQKPPSNMDGIQFEKIGFNVFFFLNQSGVC